MLLSIFGTLHKLDPGTGYHKTLTVPEPQTLATAAPKPVRLICTNILLCFRRGQSRRCPDYNRKCCLASSCDFFLVYASLHYNLQPPKQQKTVNTISGKVSNFFPMQKQISMFYAEDANNLKLVLVSDISHFNGRKRMVRECRLMNADYGHSCPVPAGKTQFMVCFLLCGVCFTH